MSEKRYEIRISTDHLRRKEVNALVVLIARAGYSTYIGYDKSVCFTGIEGDSVTEIKAGEL